MASAPSSWEPIPFLGLSDTAMPPKAKTESRPNEFEYWQKSRSLSELSGARSRSTRRRNSEDRRAWNLPYAGDGFRIRGSAGRRNTVHVLQRSEEVVVVDAHGIVARLNHRSDKDRRDLVRRGVAGILVERQDEKRV